MQNLRRYVELENARLALFGDDPMDVDNLTEAQAERLFYRIDGEMSPENLHMDGEISPAAARERAKLFTGAAEDLVELGFGKPHDLYCI